jgi:hypothetical protein
MDHLRHFIINTIVLSLQADLLLVYIKMIPDIQRVY